MKCYQRGGIVFVFILLSTYSNQEEGNDALFFREYGKLIIKVQEHFRSTCVIIHCSVDRMYRIDLKQFFDLQKTIITEGSGRTPHITIGNLSHEHRYTFNNERVLYIIPDILGGRNVLLENSTKRNTLGSTWLQFLPPSTDLDHFFDGVDVPFDCEFLVAQRDKEAVNLTEVFRVREDLPLQRFHFGTWRPKLGLQVTEPVFHERRDNLFGAVLKVAVINDPPTTMLNINGEEVEIQGFMWKLFQVLETKLNYTANVTVRDDGHWGKIHPNGTWDGVVSLLMKKQIDLCANDFVITAQRKEVVDNTISIYDKLYGVYIRRPTRTAFKWTQFLAPFSTGLWLMTTATIACTSLFMRKQHMIRRHFIEENNYLENQYSWLGSLFFVFAIFLRQALDFIPRASSCRIVILTSLVTSSVLLSAYSAVLISSLAVTTVELPFHDIKGLLQDETYKVGVFGVPMEYRLTEDTDNTNDLNQLAGKIKRLKKMDPLKSLMDGLNRVCNSKYALLLSVSVASNHQENISCQIVALPRVSFQGSLALALAKNSPYRTLFNHVLLKLKNSGSLEKLRIEAQDNTLPGSTSLHLEAELEDVMPIIVLLLASVLVSGTLLAVEQITFRVQQR